MESFYGGRSGAPFVIVKRFDGIDIPQPNDGTGLATTYTYTENEFAVNATGEFLVVTAAQGGNVDVSNGRGSFLIERNSENYKRYSWKKQKNDGSAIGATGFNFPRQLAEGMIQCFRQGAKSSSEVNYGEYVIIDTIKNMRTPNNPDNGKVFRRGMDVLAEMAGAEYIGQIVGPQGEATELDVGDYSDVINLNPHNEKSFNALNGGIVAGYKNTNGIQSFEDEIKYAYATIRDAHGNVTGCKLGFKFPTLVQDFVASSISPYTNRVAGTSGLRSEYKNLVVEDETQYQNGEWQHPFYQKWQIKVPQGYHGINTGNIEVVHSYTMPPSYKGSSIKVYNSVALNDNDVYKEITDANETHPIKGTQYEYIDDSKSNLPNFDKLYGKYYIADGGEYNADPAIRYVSISIDDGIKYVKKEDCYRDILRYKEVDFDKVEQGEVRYYYIGDYDTVERVTLSDNGILSVFYSAKPQPKELEEVLRWIDTKNSEGITIDDDGTVHVYYNTTHAPDPLDRYQKLDAKGRAHDHQDFPNVIDWIIGATLDKYGKFAVLYNNNTVKVGIDNQGHPIFSNRYETDLQWINHVSFAEDGTVTFRWNTDNIHKDAANPDATPAYQFNNVIKCLRDVSIQNINNNLSDPRADGFEGSGDQRVRVQYNNDGGSLHPIGEPLNYIVETCISKPNVKYPNVPYNHLLVYYSDPALRLKLRDKWVAYPSGKVIEREIADPADPTGVAKIPVYHIWKEWVDLGEVKGEAGGVHVIKNVTNLNELKDAGGAFIPPEKLTNAAGDVINANGAGWSCTMNSASGTGKEILFYDYNTKEWYSIGTLDSSAVDPRYIITKSEAQENQMPKPTDVGSLKVNGFWLALEKSTYAF